MFLWRIAARNILQARRRSSLLAAALCTVSLCMVLLQTLSQGVSDTMAQAATRLLTGHVNIAGFYKTRPQNAATVVTPASTVAALAKQVVPGVQVVERPRGWGKLTALQGSLQAMICGIDLQAETHLVDFMQLAQESEYTQDGSSQVFGNVGGLSRPHTAVLFAAQAQRLGVKVGDSLTLSAETLGGVQNTDEVEVVAIARDAGYLTNRHVFVHRDSVLQLFALNRDTTGLMMLYLPNMADAAQTAASVRTYLSAHHFSVMPPDGRGWRQKLEQIKNEDWTGQRLDVTTWQDELGSSIWILKTLNTLTTLFVAVLMMITLTGIVNTLWIAVRERTQEIGMLRAIGMSRLRVMLLLMLEALTLSLCATTVGSLAGAAMAVGLGHAQLHIPIDAVQSVLMNDVLTLTLRPRHIFLTIGTFSCAAALAALWPALRAARLRPLSAIMAVG
jgi:putative ABC transport system permease protein